MEFKNRILRINEYHEDDGFGGVCYYVGTPKSKEDHLSGVGALLPCMEDMKKYLPQVAKVEFSEDISSRDKITLKVLLGIN